MKTTVADHVSETIAACREKAARFTAAADQLEALRTEFGWLPAVAGPEPDPEPVPLPAARRGRPRRSIPAQSKAVPKPGVRGVREQAVRECIAVFAKRKEPFTTPALIEQAKATVPAEVERLTAYPAAVPGVLIKLIDRAEIERTGRKIGAAPEYRATAKFTVEGRTLSGPEQLHRQIRAEIADKIPQPQD